MPYDIFKRVQRLKPESLIFSQYYEKDENGNINYPPEVQRELIEFIYNLCVECKRMHIHKVLSF